MENLDLALLPEVTRYEPAGTNESPLASIESWVAHKDPRTGRPARRETNTMPQWAGSCWYCLRFIDPKNPERAWDPAKERYWMPVDLYVGGSEHAILYLLYARSHTRSSSTSGSSRRRSLGRGSSTKDSSSARTDRRCRNLGATC